MLQTITKLTAAGYFKENNMAQGGKVNYREHYKPDTGIDGPYTRTSWQTVDLVLVWLSGCSIGIVLTLIFMGN